MTLQRIRTAEGLVELELESTWKDVPEKGEGEAEMHVEKGSLPATSTTSKDGKDLPAATALAEMRELVRQAQDSIAQAQTERQALVREGEERAQRLAAIAMMGEQMEQAEETESDKEIDKETEEAEEKETASQGKGLRRPDSRVIQTEKAVCMVR